ncbi:MAG: RNA methyltransferase [Candidatus Cybelea sp.]
MATRLGVHAERLKIVAALQSRKERRESKCFVFEGPTLLEEAHAAAFPVEELYVTQAAYDRTPLVRELDRSGTPTFLVEPASAVQISDLATPTGIVAVAPVRLSGLEEIFANGEPAVVLADVGDPANAGTLLRSADAFGCSGAVCGSLGVDPYHPKVVRGSMGAVFRLRLAITEPAALATTAAAAGVSILGLTAKGEPLGDERWDRPAALVVGHERHGLGRWEACCERLLGIPMAGSAESLSAAVAGSIALYEATRRGAGR